MIEVPEDRVFGERAASLMRMATYASVGVACLLIAGKGFAWIATESVSMLSTLVDSMLDALASVVTMLAVRHALQPADHEHRFGHGKAEALAGLVQAAFITGSGLFLLLEGIERLIDPQPIRHGAWGVGVMVASIALTSILIAVQTRIARATGSLAIRADAFHYSIDLTTNIAVIVSLILSTWFEWHYLDPIVALGIVAYMAIGSFGIVRQAIDELMDRELPDADRNTIRAIALAQPGIVGVHDLRTRSSGPHRFIQVHVEMDRNLSLVEAHEISDQVMYNIQAAFPNSEVLIHQEPVEKRQ